MDRVKPVERLIAAYDDPEGVTAEFNLNLLHRINRELGGDIPLDAFGHEARWNDMLARIEMHLVAARDVDFAIAGQPLRFAKGASIHTENSHKYGPRGARLLLLAGGWTPLDEWPTPDDDFALILAEAERTRSRRKQRASARLSRRACSSALFDIVDLLLSCCHLDHHHPGDPQLAGRVQRPQHHSAGVRALHGRARPLDRAALPPDPPACCPTSAGSTSRRWYPASAIQVLKKLLAGVVTQYYLGG